MPGVRVIETTAAWWALPDAVPGVLCTPGGQHLPESAGSGGNDGRGQAEHRPLCSYVWPGRRDGARAPDVGETPLSEQEIAFGLAVGVLP